MALLTFNPNLYGIMYDIDFTLSGLGLGLNGIGVQFSVLPDETFLFIKSQGKETQGIEGLLAHLAMPCHTYICVDNLLK